MTSDFHVFYYRHRTGDMILAHRPRPISTEQIPELAQSVLEGTGDFLGLVDRDDSVLQFIHVAGDPDDQHPIRMEIPDVANDRSLIRHISNDELLELLGNLPSRLSVDVVKGGQSHQPLSAVG